MQPTLLASRAGASMLELVGQTPMVRLRRLVAPEHAAVYVKCEYFNPLGSVKERIALAMIEAAERAGEVDADCTVTESSSGNTAIALAFVCAVRGYRCQLVMPDNVGMERRRLLKHLGAELVLTPAEEGMNGAVAEAERLAGKTHRSFMPRQFSNPANPQIHRETTAQEIWRDLEGHIDVFVAGVGTGGTLTGVADFLKARNPAVRAIAVEPAESPVIRQKRSGEPIAPGKHKIQGIGAGFVPDNLNLNLVDEVIGVESNEAIEWSRRLSREEGILAGISSGANVCAAAAVAAREEHAGKTIVTIACSFGERYLSSPLFENPLDLIDPPRR